MYASNTEKYTHTSKMCTDGHGRSTDWVRDMLCTPIMYVFPLSRLVKLVEFLPLAMRLTNGKLL